MRVARHPASREHADRSRHRGCSTGFTTGRQGGQQVADNHHVQPQRNARLRHGGLSEHNLLGSRTLRAGMRSTAARSRRSRIAAIMSSDPRQRGKCLWMSSGPRSHTEAAELLSPGSPCPAPGSLHAPAPPLAGSSPWPTPSLRYPPTPSRSRDWLREDLGYLTTASAKEKIRQWFRRQEREENLAQGKEILEKEFRRLGVRPQAGGHPQALPALQQGRGHDCRDWLRRDLAAVDRIPARRVRDQEGPFGHAARAEAARSAAAGRDGCRRPADLLGDLL